MVNLRKFCKFQVKLQSKSYLQRGHYTFQCGTLILLSYDLKGNTYNELNTTINNKKIDEREKEKRDKMEDLSKE